LKAEGEKVQILLSTYNGERYLRPLLESLLAQDHPHVEILVRDDGSSDGTVSILREFETKGKLRFLHGENLGFARSFLHLLELASPEASFFAFCDQDDIWKPDKVSRAIQLLKERSEGQPALYSGRCLLVDKDLQLLAPSRIPTCEPSLGNALVQCLSAGCTMVINASARDLLVEHLPVATPSHDWWLYLVLSALGRVIYDPEPKIFYRQHESNVIGSRLRLRDKLMKRLKGKGLKLHACTDQARELQCLYGDRLNPEKRALLDRFLQRKSLLERLRYAWSGEIRGKSPKDDLKLKLLILLNYL